MATPEDELASWSQEVKVLEKIRAFVHLLVFLGCLVALDYSSSHKLWRWLQGGVEAIGASYHQAWRWIFTMDTFAVLWWSAIGGGFLLLNVLVALWKIEAAAQEANRQATVTNQHLVHIASQQSEIKTLLEQLSTIDSETRTYSRMINYQLSPLYDMHVSITEVEKSVDRIEKSLPRIANPLRRIETVLGNTDPRFQSEKKR